MAVDWSKLHEDLLFQVFQGLPVPDLFRSAAVCTSWCSISGQLRRFCHLHRRGVPWLLFYDRDRKMAISDKANAAAAAAATFFSVPEKKFYTIPLADPSVGDRKCVGSSHGWLITSDDYSELRLFNPVTGAKIEDLPPASSFDHMREESRYVSYYKALLSSNPYDGNYTIALVHGPQRKLSYARADDKKWTTIASACICHNILFHNDKLYAMCCCGDVEVWDLHESSPKAPVVIASAQRREIGNGYYRYLVPDRSGYPLQVCREPAGEGGFRFRVNRIDHRGSDGMMIKVENLGDYALLVGINQSMCLSCKDFPELRPNCIYFSDDEQNLAIRAIGVYNLEDGSAETSYELGGWLWRRATWFTASIA